MRKYLILLILFVLFVSISIILLWLGIYLPKDSDSQIEKVFFITKGEGTGEIASNLEREGFIKSGVLFRIHTLFKKVSGKLQAGEYILSSAMTVPEIAEKFVSGDVVKIIITIPEGFNLTEVAEKLSENYHNSLKIKEFKVRFFAEDFEFLKDAPKEASLEGFLFPDTYQFSSKDFVEDMVQRMLLNFDRKLSQDIRKEINRQGKTIFKTIIMASLIEKEVKSFEDKELVAGILWKRLDNGMPLQVDATIAYITGKKTTKVSKTDTQIDSPYNTYKYPDLPLGPISNPGLESILAAIYPKDNPFWYYLSTPEGETIFSKTLEEHNIAKAKYLK